MTKAVHPVAPAAARLGGIGGGVVGIDDHGHAALQDPHGLGVAGDLEERLQLLEPERRMVAERLDLDPRGDPSSRSRTRRRP